MIPTLHLGGLGFSGGAGGGGGGPPGATTTLNPADKHASITLSNGDLTATRAAGSSWVAVRSTESRNAGKLYFEVTHDASGGNAGALAGLMAAGDSLSQHIGHTSQSADDCGWMYDYNPNSYKFQNSTTGTAISGYGYLATGGRADFAIDFDAGKAWFRNSSGSGWAGGGDPAAGTSPTLTFTPGATMYAALSLYFATHAATFNFGQSVFAGAVPSGFSEWG